MVPSGHSVGGSSHSGGGSSRSQIIVWQLGGVPVVPSGHIHSSPGVGSFGSHGGDGGNGGDVDVPSLGTLTSLIL
jgi:hypothetical protein